MKTQEGSSNQRSLRDLSDDLVATGLGNREAFERVYKASARKLYSLCLQITGQRNGADDVLQETFIKIWNRAPGFDPDRASAMAWLGAIARNSSIDWYRAHHRRTFVTEDAVSLILDGAESAEHRIIREQEETRALGLLGELPPDQEADLRSVFFTGLTYAELAERKGIPLNTLKSRIRRGLLSLSRKFDDD
jgi:RNA polymerase sigma factor (sigma-70 family)